MNSQEKASVASSINLAELIEKANRKAEKSASLSSITLRKESFFSRATSTGSLCLDKMLGGGIPPSRIIGIAGPNHSGKSLLVTQIAYNQCQAKRVSSFQDAEGGSDPIFLKARGIDFGKFVGEKDKKGLLKKGEMDYWYLYQPTTGEQVTNYIHTLCQAMPENRNPDSAPVIFFLDSVVALITDKLSEDIDSNKMALHARMYSELLPIIRGDLNRTGCSLVYVNQMRLKPGVSYGDPAYEPCFVGSTRIATDHGLVRIEDCVDSNYKAVTPEGEISVESKFVRTGKKETIILALRNGMELEVTPNHKVSTTEGDLEAKDCLNKRVLLTPGGCFGEECVDPDVGTLLGWTTGDGWLTSFDSYFGVCFGPQDYLAKEVIVDIIKNRYGPVHPVRARGKNTTVDTYRCGKKAINNDFKNWGWKPAKSADKEVPEIIFRSSKDVQSAYLSALFCADGTVRSLTKSGRDCVELTTVSKELARQVQLLLLNFSVTSSIHLAVRTGNSEFKIVNKPGEVHEVKKSNYYRVVITGEAIENFKQCIGFGLSPQKQAKLMQVKWKKELDLTCEVVDLRKGFTDRHVFDVKEPITNHVHANGVIAHNCGEALKFHADIRLNLKTVKPKLGTTDHPFITPTFNQATPKAGGIWQEDHIDEKSGEAVGLDRYIYTAITSVKNKVFTPHKVCWMRIHFDENGGTGRGLDQAFDIFTFLADCGYIRSAVPRGEGKEKEKVTDIRPLWEITPGKDYDLHKELALPDRFDYQLFKSWAKAPGLVQILREDVLSKVLNQDAPEPDAEASN